MTDDSQFALQTQYELGRDLLGTPSVACRGARRENDTCHSHPQDQNQSRPRDNSRMGKPRLDESTREAKRLALLVDILGKVGHPEHGRLNQLQIATMTGVEVTHINKIVNNDRPRGLGADIIRKMRDGLKIDPMFFFDDKEPTDLNVYILAEKRIQKRFDSIEERLAALEASSGEVAHQPAVRKVKR